MKNFKGLITLLALLSGFQFSAQNTIDLSKYNCMTASVKFYYNDEPASGILMFMNYQDREIQVLHYSDVYILNKSGQNLKLSSDSISFTGVNDIKVSKNSKYLAVYVVGEGHPWIEIYDLQKMINEQKQDLITDINPYPGYIEMVGWQNDELIINSDTNLLLKNENKDISDTDMYEKPKTFIFNLNDRKFRAVK